MQHIRVTIQTKQRLLSTIKRVKASQNATTQMLARDRIPYKHSSMEKRPAICVQTLQGDLERENKRRIKVHTNKLKVSMRNYSGIMNTTPENATAR